MKMFLYFIPFAIVATLFAGRVDGQPQRWSFWVLMPTRIERYLFSDKATCEAHRAAIEESALKLAPASMIVVTRCVGG